MQPENKSSYPPIPPLPPVVMELTKKGPRIKGLTKKKMKFIDEYFNNGFNPALAYASVYQSVTKGTAYSNSAKLLKSPDVELEIMQRQAAIAKSEQIHRSDIVKTLRKLVQRYEEDGAGAREAIKALDMMCRLGGLYPKEPTINNVINNEVVVSFTDPSFDPDFKDKTSGSVNINTQNVDYSETRPSDTEVDDLEDSSDDDAEL